jgi:hypothetical protein
LIDNSCKLDAILKEKRKHGFGQMHILDDHPLTKNITQSFDKQDQTAQATEKHLKLWRLA